MSRRIFYFCGVLLLTAVLATWLNAGNLNPPGGPISPTGVTLDDIGTQIQNLQTKVAALSTGCNDCVWENAELSLGGTHCVAGPIVVRRIYGVVCCDPPAFLIPGVFEGCPPNPSVPLRADAVRDGDFLVNDLYIDSTGGGPGNLTVIYRIP